MPDTQLLGWREWISFPQLNIPNVKAKIDTGARSSALHAFRVSSFMRDEQEWVSFSLHPFQRNTETVIDCEAPVIDRRIVRDSGGHEELRYLIATQIKVGGHLIDAEVTLTDRESMQFRVLLGRTALRQKFLVDAGKSYLCGKPVRRSKHG